MSTYERLIAVIRAFVEAESWGESREIVERHQELLTTDVGAALETFARNAEEAGDADMARTFRVHRALLRRCAEVGTVAAFLELDAPAGGPPQGPGLEIPREVLTDELLALSREVWTVAANTASPQWWERRIQLLERGIALTEGNPDAAPMWATFHVELANTLRNTPTRERSANIERAIASFEMAAQVWTSDVAPQQWAMIQENLAKAYDQRVLGDPGQNRARANVYRRACGAAVDDAPDDDELVALVQELEALCEVADGLPRDDPIVNDVVRRADRVLALTRQPDGHLAIHARFTACCERARFLARRGDAVDALPSAREAAEMASRGRGAEARSRERYMRLIMGEALEQLDQQIEAADEFVRAAQLAIPDGDATTIEGALLGLGMLRPRQQERIPIGLQDLPSALAATGMRHFEARCRVLLAGAMDRVPAESRTEPKLAVVDEYLRAMRLFNELGEVGAAADACYSAGDVLGLVSWLYPEHRERSLALYVDAERLYRKVENWHGLGATQLGQAELLNALHPGIERDDARVDELLDAASEAFRTAGRPDWAADAMLMRARLVGLHSGFSEQFVDLCCAAFEYYEAGRSCRLLATEREHRDQQASYTISFLGADIWDHLRVNPSYSRRDALVWGLEQLTKGRSFQDQQMAPTIWQRFLAKDDRLRELTEELEQARVELEGALRRHDGQLADAARSAVERALRLQRERLEGIATDSVTELGLTSVPPVAWQEVQHALSPGEVYVGLTVCPGARFLRTRLTSTEAHFEAVMAPDLNPLHVLKRKFERLDPAELALVHRRAYDLLGLPASGVDTLVICPDRHLVDIPWHLLDADDSRSPLGDRMAIGVVPSAGAWVQWAAKTTPPDTPQTLSYLGVADRSTNLQFVDMEVQNVRDSYFPETGRYLITGHSHELLDERGHVSLLHVASHAVAAGFAFTGRTVTPIDLADMQLTADVLLLTGCYLGAFGDDESNEFIGIVRQLLISTGARAAVVSLAPVVDAAGPLFSDLVVSALTGQAPHRPWTLPAGPMNVGDAVRWARLRMRDLAPEAARWLHRDVVGSPEPKDASSWWAPWFVVGDPKARLAGARSR